VGVEEFVLLCREVGAEPLVCVRWTGKTPEDAAHQVEYFNGDASTPWGTRRVKNGHPEPYGVKYWQIGNEVRGTNYDGSVAAFAQAMKRADPSIKILSSFPSPEVLKQTGNLLDYVCPHHYGIRNWAGTEKDFRRLREGIAQNAAGRDVRIAVTEWNTTAGNWGTGRGMLQTLENALSCSRYQNLMHPV
jgi:alpha-N-arabinofuranosidase